MHDRHELRASLRFFGKIKYFINDLYFNIILNMCILFVVNGGEHQRKYDLGLRRQYKIRPINRKLHVVGQIVSNCSQEPAVSSFPKLFAVLSRESRFFQHLKSMSVRAYICCLFVALHEDVPHITNKFYFIIYTDISIPISIHDVCETGGRVIGKCFKHQNKERTS